MSDLRGRIAVIGWGSLIWDLDNLAPFVEGPWLIGAGPDLPMEFSRVSPKRKMGLAVCLDAAAGVPCRTNAILSTRTDVAEAAADLATRERAAQPELIGLIHPATGALRAASPPVAAVFADWCAATGAAGAVWTDLPPNFAEMTGRPFTVAAGVAYLKTLTGESRDEAVRYIENAPAATDTPLRRALAEEVWWRDEAARVARMDLA